MVTLCIRICYLLPTASRCGPGVRGYSDQRRAFCSAAEILLRIYQNPIHLNETRWRTGFWTKREVRRGKKRGMLRSIYTLDLIREQQPMRN